MCWAGVLELAEYSACSGGVEIYFATVHCDCYCCAAVVYAYYDGVVSVAPDGAGDEAV